MHFFLQIWANLVHIWQESFLGDPHLACAQLDNLAIFGDLATYLFVPKMVIYIVAQVIKVNVALAALAKQEMSENYRRVSISVKFVWRATTTLLFMAYYISIKTIFYP